MRRSFRNVSNFSASFHYSLKSFIFFSIGINTIKHEMVYMYGWYLTVIFLSLSINGLNSGLNIFTVCFFIFSIAQTTAMVFVGFKYGKKGEQSECNPNPGFERSGKGQ